MNVLSLGKKLRLGLVSTCIAFFVSACGDPPPMNQTSQPIQEEVVESPTPYSIPVSRETRKTYQWYCAQCHGLEGKGDGINAPWVTVPPRNHTKADYLETRSNQELFDTIKFGGLAMGRAPCMPAWGHTLDDKMIKSLVNLIRELCQCEAI